MFIKGKVMQQGFFDSFDNTKIYYYEWDDVKDPKGVVQIIHGMAEHAGRYDNFAKFLNQNGLIVFADDHRAHGNTAGVDNLGKYDGFDLFEDTLQDEIFISQKLKNKYKLPLYVLGHSYGSFITQAYIQRCQLYDKAIICGSALMKNRLDVKLGKFIAKTTMKHKGKDAPAKLIEKINFGGYNKKVKSGSWLNTDEGEVKKYFADKFCGKPFSAKFYVDFFSSFDRIYKKSYVLQISKDKPIFLIAGDKDPVGSMGKSVIKLFKFYKKLDLDVRIKLYKGARHEILNEKIKETVYNDVLEFINAK